MTMTLCAEAGIRVLLSFCAKTNIEFLQLSISHQISIFLSLIIMQTNLSLTKRLLEVMKLEKVYYRVTRIYLLTQIQKS